MVGTGVGSCGAGRGNQQQSQSADMTPVVAQIGEFKLTVGQIEQAYQQQVMQELPPQQAVTFMGGVLRNQVGSGLILQIAKQRNVPLDDATIRKTLEGQRDRQLEEAKLRARLQLMSSGRLKPDATDAEFEQLAAEQGLNFASERQRMTDQIEQILKTPSMRESASTQAALEGLTAQLERGIQVSDADLRASFNDIEVKRILFKDREGETAMQQAEKVAQELKGGLGFDAAVDRYSKDAPVAGKRLSESTIKQASRFWVSPLDVLRTMKAGETTKPLKVPEGVAIYRIVKVTPNLPNDFGTRNAQYRQELVKSRANEQIDKLIEQSESLIKWQSPVYEALYAFQKMQQDALQGGKTPADYRALQQKVEAANPDDDPTRRVQALVRYGAFMAAYQLSSKAEQAKMEEERIDVLSTALNYVDNTAERLQLAELLADRKDKAAFDNLMIAAERNVSEIQNVAESTATFEKANALAARLQKEGLIDAEQMKQYEGVKKTWLDTKKAMDEELKRQAEEQKRLEEEARKAEEDAKRQQNTTPRPRSESSPSPSPSPAGQ